MWTKIWKTAKKTNYIFTFVLILDFFVIYVIVTLIIKQKQKLFTKKLNEDFSWSCYEK